MTPFTPLAPMPVLYISIIVPEIDNDVGYCNLLRGVFIEKTSSGTSRRLKLFIGVI